MYAFAPITLRPRILSTIIKAHSFGCRGPDVIFMRQISKLCPGGWGPGAAELHDILRNESPALAAAPAQLPPGLRD